MTSLLRPSGATLSFFNGFPTFGQILGEQKVATRKLDDIAEVDSIHFLKMDIQGSELMVLKNGLGKLTNCVAIQIEVPFVCLYENQPTFGEIDLRMREQGFLPHRFLEVKRWSIASTTQNNDFRIPFNQLLEADIVYIKNPLDLPSFSSTELKMLALMSDGFFASPDLCIHCLKELIGRGDIAGTAINDYLSPPKSG